MNAKQPQASSSTHYRCREEKLHNVKANDEVIVTYKEARNCSSCEASKPKKESLCKAQTKMRGRRCHECSDSEMDSSINRQTGKAWPEMLVKVFFKITELIPDHGARSFTGSWIDTTWQIIKRLGHNIVAMHLCMTWDHKRIWPERLKICTKPHYCL